jgi:hypothetical protein
MPGADAAAEEQRIRDKHQVLSELSLLVQKYKN